MEKRYYACFGWTNLTNNRRERRILFLDIDKKHLLDNDIEAISKLMYIVKSKIHVIHTDNGFHVYSFRLLSNKTWKKALEFAVTHGIEDKTHYEISMKRGKSTLRLSPSFTHYLTFPLRTYYPYFVSCGHIDFLRQTYKWGKKIYTYERKNYIYSNKLPQGIEFEIYQTTKNHEEDEKMIKEAVAWGERKTR